MTKKQIQKEIDRMSAVLGWSNIEMLSADFGRAKFKSTKTSHKIRYTRDGQRYTRAAGGPSIYYALKFYSGTGETCVECGGSGSVYRSNYGSSVKCMCPTCGGYARN